MGERLKLAHKVVVDLVNWANRKSCVTLLRYNVDRPGSSYTQVRFFPRKKEDKNFQQVTYLNYKLEDFVYLLDVLNSVYDKVVTNKFACIILWN